MEILKEHLRIYPAMTPADVIKLLYQRAFGGGHIVKDSDAARAFLRREYDTVVQTRTDAFVEPVGGKVVRLYLDGILPASLDTVCRLFVESAAHHRADPTAFASDLNAVTALAAAGETPFPLTVWEDALAAYRAEGCPMIRHSAAYRSAYAPAYRVIAEDFVKLLPLLFAIDQKIDEKGRAVLAIDGMCGSGKSTLAQWLARLYGASIVPMDDFFLPPHLRTEERLQTPGGNIHHERFAAEVLPHLGGDAPFCYRPFDCGTMTEGEMVTVPPRPLTIVEGSYALHPALRDAYDLTVYLSCTAEEQISRLTARCRADGCAGLISRFVNEWIPMEHHYAAAFSVRERADFVMDTTDMEKRG